MPLGGLLIMDGLVGVHRREEKPPKREPGDVGNKSLPWGKGLCLVTEKFRLVELDGTGSLENLEWIVQCRPQGTTARSVSRGVPWCLTESHYHCDLKCSCGQYVGFFKVFSPHFGYSNSPFICYLLLMPALAWRILTSLSLVLAVSDGCVSEGRTKGRVEMWDFLVPEDRGETREAGTMWLQALWAPLHSAEVEFL